MPEAAVLERPTEEYKSDTKPTWCPGCGDFGVLNATYNAMRKFNLDPKDVVCVSGIGCSGRFPFFVSSYGFHGLHGRSMPLATGVRTARPDLTVLVFGGDGDGFSIGAGHFMHAARRNLDITYVVMDNSVYGLTKGQPSPTASIGYVAKTTPRGNPDQPVNPLVYAIACGATFVARGFSGRPKEIADLICEGIQHKGFSFINVYSPCPTFNKVQTFKFYKEEVEDLPAGHEPSDRIAALTMASIEDPIYTGKFYQTEGAESFEDHLIALQPDQPQDPREVVESLFKRYS